METPRFLKLEPGKLEEHYSIFDWWKKVFIYNFSNFSGRARRKEYWMYVLFNLMLYFVYVLVLMSLFGIFSMVSKTAAKVVLIIMLIPFVIYIFANFIPTLAVSIRRIQDTGNSGWLWLISFIPGGSTVLFVFYCIDGTRGPNRYGNDPKDYSAIYNEIDQLGKTNY